MDGHKQSATDRSRHGGTRVTFTEANWKDPCIGLWKRPAPVLIWGQLNICTFSQEENEAQWLPGV